MRFLDQCKHRCGEPRSIYLYGEQPQSSQTRVTQLVFCKGPMKVYRQTSSNKMQTFWRLPLLRLIRLLVYVHTR